MWPPQAAGVGRDLAPEGSCRRCWFAGVETPLASPGVIRVQGQIQAGRRHRCRLVAAEDRRACGYGARHGLIGAGSLRLEAAEETAAGLPWERP